MLAFLQGRQSVAKLSEPAPNAEQLEQVFIAANRAPDHGLLKPWRFLVIEGDKRQALGRLFVQAAQADDGNLSVDKLESIQGKALRAPMIIVAIVKTQAHKKVPVQEQKLAAGCAAYNVLLAANALGFDGIWRTGAMAYDKTVRQGLGLADNEFIIGFFYLGTAQGLPEKPVASAAHWQYWAE